MKKAIFILFLIICNSTYGQLDEFLFSKQKDSLELLIRKDHDTLKVKHYLALINLFEEKNPDTVIVITNKIFSILNKSSNERFRSKTIKKILGQSHFLQGERYRMRNEKTESIRELNEAILVFRDIGDSIALAQSLFSLYKVNSASKGNPETLSLLIESNFIFSEIRDSTMMISTFQSLAIVYKDLVEYEISQKYYLKCIALFIKNGDNNLLASIYNSYGDLLRKMGDHEESYRILRIASEILKGKGNETEAFNYLSMGNLYHDMGKNVESIHCYEQSLEIYKSLNKSTGIANCLNNLGIIYKDQGNFEKSLEYYKTSVEIKLKNSGSKNISITYNNIGVVLKELERYEEAIQYYNKTLDLNKDGLNKKIISTTYSNLGVSYRLMNDFERAIEFFEKSVEIEKELGNGSGQSLSLGNLGSAFIKIGKVNQGMALIRKAFQLSVDNNNVIQIKDNSRKLYNNYGKLGMSDSAKWFLNRLLYERDRDIEINFLLLPENEREFYIAQINSDFEYYYDYAFHHSQNNEFESDTCFNLALQQKGFAFKSTAAIRTSILKSNDSLVIEKYEKWLEIKMKNTSLYETGKYTKEAENEVKKIEEELIEYSDVLSEFKKIRSMNWGQIQKRLNKNEAAIEFVHYLSGIDTLNPFYYEFIEVPFSLWR